MFEKFKWVKRLFTAPVEALSPYQQAILLFKGMVLKNASVYRDFSTVVACEKNLHDYTLLITKAIHALERGVHFYGVGDSYRPTMCEFFMGPGGTFVPVAVTQRVFIDAAIELLELYERTENSEDLTGNQLNTLTRVYPVVRNLCDLSIRLNEDL